MDRFHADKQTTQPTTMERPNPQASSLFFQKLPTEMRLNVYSHLFFSTRLSLGRRQVHFRDKLSHVRIRTAPNSLSLLRVCRRVSYEIGDSWLGQVLFSFEDPETMLDKLADLKPRTLGRLRHMRYSGERKLMLPLRADDGNHKMCTYGLCEILKLLPGLCLDRLTVLSEPMAQRKNRRLNSMIEHSNGWKELCYLSNNSAILGFGGSDKVFGMYEWYGELRAPQPSTWSQALIGRDGPTASVSVYRSSDATASGSMISKPATCRAFADQVAELGEEDQYGVEPDTALMMPGEKEKEILIVARRGKGVDYTEHGTSPTMDHDIRKNWPGMKWGQIRYMSIGWFEELLGREIDNDDADDDELLQGIDTRTLYIFFGFFDYPLRKVDGSPTSNETAGIEVDEHGFLIKVDNYKHADDYEWSPSHTDFGLD